MSKTLQEQKLRAAMDRHRRAQAGQDREEFFSRDGVTAADWRGGRAMVNIDRRREDARTRCRGYDIYDDV